MRSEGENWRISRTSDDGDYGKLFHEIAFGQVTYLPDIAPLKESGIYTSHEREALRLEQQIFLQAMAALEELEGDEPPAIDLRVGKPAGLGTTPKLFIAIAGRVTVRDDEKEAEKYVHIFWDRLSSAFPWRYGFTEPMPKDTLFRETVLPSLEDLQSASVWDLVKEGYPVPKSDGPGHIAIVGTYSEMLDSMITSWEAIARSPKRILLSVRLMPLPKSDAEKVRAEFTSRVQSYARDAGKLQNTSLAIKDAIQRFNNLLRSTQLLRLRIQLVSWDDDPLTVKSSIMASLTSSLDPQQRGCECHWHRYTDEGDKKQVQAEIAYVCAEKRKPEALLRLDRLKGTEPPILDDYDLVNVWEASAAWRLPLAQRYRIPGIQFRRDHLFAPEPIPFSSPSSTDERKREIWLGTIVDSRRYRHQQLFHVNGLTKHMLISGETGSGKSTTTQSLLYQLWKAKIPGMVIDPVSTEYCELWALSSIFRDKPVDSAFCDGSSYDPLQSLLVFNPGAAGKAGTRLAFNPFCPQSEISLDAHIMSLKDCFSSALALPEWWKELVGRAIRNVYEDFGWPASDPELNREPITDIEKEERSFPTLIDFIKAVEREISRYRFTEYRSNTEAALLGRLRDLAAGPLGAMVNTQRSLDVAQLVDRPVVIQLRSIRQPDAKSLIILFLLTQLRQHYDSWERSRNIKHVLIVEEAHRLLSPSPTQVEIDKGSDSRAESIEIIVDMLAELRKLGVGIVLVEQLPSRLEANVVKLPGVKVLHRLSAKDDREMIAQAMNMTPEQTNYVTTLTPGQATLYAEGAIEPVLLQMADPWEEIRPLGRWFDRPESPENQKRLEGEVEAHMAHAWLHPSKKDEPWNPCKWCRCGCRPRMRLLEEERQWWTQIEIDDTVRTVCEQKDNRENLPEFASYLWERVIEANQMWKQGESESVEDESVEDELVEDEPVEDEPDEDELVEDELIEEYDDLKDSEELRCGLTLALEGYVIKAMKFPQENKDPSLTEIKAAINQILQFL
jgi:Helicase HerA, central domain